MIYKDDCHRSKKSLSDCYFSRCPNDQFLFCYPECGEESALKESEQKHLKDSMQANKQLMKELAEK